MNTTLDRIIKMSAYLIPAHIEIHNGGACTYPKLNVRLTKNNYYLLEKTLEDFINIWSSFRKNKEIVIPHRKLQDIKLKNSEWKNGSYYIKCECEDELIDEISTIYQNELKSLQENYKYLIS